MACHCFSPCCAAQVPCCSHPKSHVQYVGVPKLHSILCSQDVDEPFKANRKKFHYHGYNIFTYKLGYPIGVLRSMATPNEKVSSADESEMYGQRFAMCLKAFALFYLVPVNEWGRPVLDSLMLEGAELYAEGPPETVNQNNEQLDESNGDNIYSKDEMNVRRSFKLMQHEFAIELNEKFIPCVPNALTSGDMLPEIPISLLKQAMTEFFRNRKYGLLSTTNFCLLILKVDGMFFVVDFYGRSPITLELQRNGGYAMLLCLRLVDNVYYLVTHMSNIGNQDAFVLREMRIAILIDPDGRAIMRPCEGARADQFVRFSEDYAYLKSALHLSIKEKDPLLLRCALPVAIAAIMASKIDHPAAWDEKTLDKIICYGFFVCRCCWEYCQNSQKLTDFDSFPSQLQIGQFAVSLTLIARAYQGTWRCVPLNKSTDLSDIIQKCFEKGENHLLIAINEQIYSIWKKNGYYYLFDPYRHRLPDTKNRSASLRMFSSLPLFLNVLNLTLLQSNTSTTFYIHRVVVTEIKMTVTSECLAAAPIQVCPEDISDTKSINDIIYFREDYKTCLADLGQESEDESSDSFDPADMEDVEEEETKVEEEGEEGGILSGFDGASDDDDSRFTKSNKSKAKQNEKPKEVENNEELD